MTRAQGDRLLIQVSELEDEVAKLQRVRHDMEVLMVGQVRDIIDRIARLEGQLGSFKESLSEGSTRNSELVAEIQNLRNELEEAQHRYKNLENDQLSLFEQRAKNSLKKEDLPPTKEEHFALAKKQYVAQKFDEAILLFESFITTYPDEGDLLVQSYYLLGEIFSKLADTKKTPKEKENFQKKSIVSLQKVIEINSDAILREEALFKMGLIFKAMNNRDGAVAAFKELLAKHSKGKRAEKAKSLVAELEKKK